MNNERFYELALTMLPDIGAITAKKLIAYTGSAEAVFRERKSSLLLIPGIGKHILSRIDLSSISDAAQKECRYIEKNGVEILAYWDQAYPEKLKNCEDGPVLLYRKGMACPPDAKILSIVGTRSATSEGKELCRSIVEGLAARFPELVVVSGLAYGIDIVAHRAALDHSVKTLAVLAHGLHTIYPAQHRETAERITRQGALLTDFTTRQKPERNNFLRRNRIIAGLSDATLVIESGEKGGAMITAELAASYNRDVLAVPGRVSDTRSRGCNLLIKKNIAALVEGPDDVSRMLNWEPESLHTAPVPLLTVALTSEEEQFLRLIETEREASPEYLSLRTGMPVHTCISALVTMELRGWLSVLPGNRYRLKIRLP